MQNFQELFDGFSKVKVGVVGDVMLDTYMWGSVERISPEAPVPIVSLQKKELRIGGAGNVALNLQSLKANSFIITIIGDDDDGYQLNHLFEQNGINSKYSFASKQRLTTNKTRIISRNQQMMRLDAELTNDINAEDEKRLIKNFKEFVQKEAPQIVIFEDYNKGVLTKNVIHQLIKICKAADVLTAVDPKRKNFFEYKEVDIFKPNLKEVKEALNLISTSIELESLEQIHEQLHNKLQHHISFITLSEKGVFYQEQNQSAIIPSHLRNISDVSGAGDTVIAVASLIYAATKNVFLMAEIANIAGGMVCEEAGTVAIDRLRLLHECELLLE